MEGTALKDGPPPAVQESSEQPQVTLADALKELRQKQPGYGRSIGIGTTDEEGQPKPDTNYIGHILPIGEKNGLWHLIIMNNGTVAVVGEQPGEQNKAEYQKTYSGQGALLFHPGISASDAYYQLASKQLYRDERHGGITLESTDYYTGKIKDSQLEHERNLQISVDGAIATLKTVKHINKNGDKANEPIDKTQDVRTRIGQYAANSLHKALS